MTPAERSSGMDWGRLPGDGSAGLRRGDGCTRLGWMKLMHVTAEVRP